MMYDSFFVSDLHGKIEKYEKLFSQIINQKPENVFIGGDLLSFRKTGSDFIEDYLIKNFVSVKEKTGSNYPDIFLIMGNDDPKYIEDKFIMAGNIGLWHYLNNSCVEHNGYAVFGYPFVPPTPFLLKDWEKFDVSRYVDPGCVPPDKGKRTVEINSNEIEFSTIKLDLEKLSKGKDLLKSIFLFHSPPYQTNLDRAALDGQMFEHAPLDVHVGSIAIKKFIELQQPFITLHGHIHESTRITGEWKQIIGKTISFQASHEGKELSVIKFNIANPLENIRELI